MNFKKYSIHVFFIIQILKFNFVFKPEEIFSSFNKKTIFCENINVYKFYSNTELNKEKYENYYIFANSGIVSFRDKIRNWNEKGFLYINKFAKKSKILDALFIFFSSLGKEYILIPIVCILIYFKKRNGFKKLFFIFILSIFIGEIIVHILKIVISFPRPFVYFGEEKVNLLEKPLTKYSFPSGHAFVAFTGALFLSWILPKWKFLFILIATLTGFSRCYMGVHFPLDIIGGFFIGFFSFWSVRFTLNKKF